MGDHLPRRSHPARLHHLIPPQPKHPSLINHLATQNLSRPLARLSHDAPFWSAAAQLPLLHTNPHHKSYPRAPDRIIPELSLNRISTIRVLSRAISSGEQAPLGATHVSPARKRWVRNPKGPQAP